MIYTKQANFPYPLLSNDSDDYNNALFDLDVSLSENNEGYILDLFPSISSAFVKDLLRTHQARLLLVIKSKDNQFYELEDTEHFVLRISRSRLSFSQKTIMQLMIQTTEKVSFEENDDLNKFYQNLKKDIVVQKGMALGFSGTVIFDGSQKKPYELFEKRYDPEIRSDIKISLTDEVIVVSYKQEEIMFSDIPKNRDLTNPYLYIGLERALTAFLIQYAEPNEEVLDIEDINQTEMHTPLDGKLLSLMKNKRITELDLESIDEVIYLISDQMLKKYADRIREGVQS